MASNTTSELPIYLKLDESFYSSNNPNDKNTIEITAQNDIQNVTYTLPSISKSGVLSNDGGGNLSWSPATEFSTTIEVNNDNTDGIIKLIQNGDGDSSIRFTDSATNYNMGIDRNDSHMFKLSNSINLGTNDLFTMQPDVIRFLRNSSGVTPFISLKQSGSGDSNLGFTTSGDSYIIGIDASDSNKFKISHSNELGTNDILTVLPTGLSANIITLPDTQFDGSKGLIYIGSTRFASFGIANNLFIGNNGGTLTTFGSGNLAIGKQSLSNLTIGNYNIGLGSESGKFTTDGSGNTFVGYQAGITNTTGSYNLALGYNANIGVVGIHRTAIGYGSVALVDDSMVLGNGSIKVGIRTSSPTEALDVVGNVIASGDITTSVGNVVITAGNLNITSGNITLGVGGTVDGADISVWKSDYDSKIDQDVRVGAYPEFQNITDLQFSGFNLWAGAGLYWSITGGNTFNLLRGGDGYIRSKHIVFTAPQSIIYVTFQPQYIYIDSNGILNVTNSISLAFLQTNILLFTILSDGTNHIVKRDDHPYTFITSMTWFFHINLGSIIQGQGAVLEPIVTPPGDGSLITHGQVKIVGSDVFEDHGNNTDIPDSLGSAITFYTTYTDTLGHWIQRTFTTTFPLEYNNTGVPTAIGAGNYCVYRIFVTGDDINTTNPRFIAIMNDTEYASLIDAQTTITNGSIVGISGAIECLDMAQLGYVIIQNAGTSGFGIISDVIVQKDSFSAKSAGTGGGGGSHILLSDLNGGTYQDGGHTYLAQTHEINVPPTTLDDSLLFKNEALWLNTASRDIYLCVDNTAGSAIWKRIAWSNLNEIVIGPLSSSTSYGISIGTSSIAWNNGVSIGYNAGSGSIAGAIENTFIGHNAGSTNTTGSWNLALGSGASVGTTGTHRTAIGYGSAALVDDSMVLGDGSIKVGIRTSSPTEALDVTGNVSATRLILRDGIDDSNKITIQVPNITVDQTLTLPSVLPAASEIGVLSVNSSGTSIWNNVLYDANMTGFAQWEAGAVAPYWSYTRPNFTVIWGGFGYIKGKRVSWTAGQVIAIAPLDENFILVDSSGVITSQHLVLPDTFINNMILFSLYDDGISPALVKKEQHPISFDSGVSSYLHQNVGTVVTGSGGDIDVVLSGIGASLDNRRLKISGAMFSDHGVYITFGDLGSINILYYYLNGSGDWIIDVDDLLNPGTADLTLTPIIDSTVVPLVYNSAGTITGISQNYYAIMRIYGTMDSQNSSIPQFVGIIHTTQYATISAANYDISLGLISEPTPPLTSMELIQLGYIIIRNTGLGYIEEILIQKNTLNALNSGGKAFISHIILADLDAGPNGDGEHANLVTRRIESTVPIATNDDIGTAGEPGSKTLSLWLDNTIASNPDIYCNIINTTSAAKWSQIVTGLANSSSGNLFISPTNMTPTFRSGLIGTHNTIIGQLSGLSITNAAENTILGYNSMPVQTTGIGNTIVGHGCASVLDRAGGAIDLAFSNCVVGYNSFIGATTASKCVVIGDTAANSITTGTCGIFIGHTCDGSATHHNQISIGPSALTNGDDTIAIGNGASASGLDAIAIGAGATAGAGEHVFGMLNLSSSGLTGVRTISFPNQDLSLITPTFTTSVSLVRNSNTLILEASATNTGYTWTFPLNGGNPGYLLQTDGSGLTSWTSSITSDSLLLKTNLSLEDPGIGTNTITLGVPSGLALSYSLTFPPALPGVGVYGVLESDSSGILTWQDSPTLTSPLCKTSLRLEDPGVGLNTLSLSAANTTATYTITFPNNVGTAGSVLKTVGAGILSWSSNTRLDNLTDIEINQLENINTSTISTSQWGYLSALNQSISSGASPTWNSALFTTNIQIEDYGVGSNIVTIRTTSPTNTYTITLPNTGGTAGALLKTTGSGTLNWTTSTHLDNLTDAEITQLENIDANTISSTQWGYLSTLDQSVATNASPTWISPLFKTGLKLEDPGVGTFSITLQAPTLVGNITLTWPSALPISGTIGLLESDSNGIMTWTNSPTFDSPLFKTSIRIEDPGIGTNYVSLQAPITLFASYSITLPSAVGAAGKLLKTTDNAGTLDWTTSTRLDNLTDAEITQLENINANTISSAQWGYISALDQSIASGDSPTWVSPLFKTSVRLEDPGVGANYITLGAPTLTSSYSLVLPNALPSTGAFGVLESNDTGALTWTNSPVFDSPLFKTSIRLEDPGVGANYITLGAPTLAFSYSLVFPNVVGTTGKILKTTDGAGTLAWTTNTRLDNLTDTEITQLENIDANTISNAQWGYLGSMDQNVATGASPTWISPLFKTSLKLEDPGVGVFSISIESPTLLGDYSLTLPNSVGSAGKILKTTDSAGTLAWTTSTLLDSLTDAEITQLMNINANTISATQWGYIGALDQSIASGDSPTWISPLFKTSVRLEDPGIGANYVTLGAPTLASSYSLMLPNAVGATGKILKTIDGAGTLAWTTNTRLDNLTDAEITQLENIDANTISNTQWGYIGALDQSIASSDSPTWISPLFKTSIRLEDPGVGANYITLGAPTLASSYSLVLPNVVGAAGKILKTTDGAGTLAWTTSTRLDNLTDSEITQLENINANTISSAQWGYVSSLSQLLGITDDVSFGTITATKNTIGTISAYGGVAVTGNAGFTLGRNNTSEGEFSIQGTVTMPTFTNMVSGDISIRANAGTLRLGVGAINTNASTCNIQNGQIGINVAPVTGKAISIKSNLVLYNSLGTAYSDITTVATSNRTVSFPDRNLDLTTPTFTNQISLGRNSQFLSLAASSLASAIYTITFPPAPNTSSGMLLKAIDNAGTLDWTTSTQLDNLTDAEITQLENINANTISSTQWGYLSALDQSIASSDSPTWISPLFKTSVRLEDSGIGTFLITIGAPTLTSSYSLVLPNALPGTGTFGVLESNDAGALTWTGSPTLISPLVKTSLLFEDSGVGTNTITWAAPSGLSSSYSQTWPSALPGVGTFGVLESNNSGITSWNASPTLISPLIKTSILLEDAGVGTSKITLGAPTLASDYSITLPNVLPTTAPIVKTGYLQSDNTGICNWNALPYDGIDSGFAEWSTGASTPYWSYNRPTFTLIYGGYGYIRGKKVTWSAGQTVACTALAENMIYINSGGILTRGVYTTQMEFDNILLFELYEDNTATMTTAPLVKKNNHTVGFNISTSYFFNVNLGPIVSSSGANMAPVLVGTGASPDNRRMQITGGSAYDVSVSTTWSSINPTTVRTFYTNAGGQWIQNTQDVTTPGSATPLKTITDYTLLPLVFNNAGTITGMTSNHYMVIRMYVLIDSLNSTTPQFIGVLDTTTNITIGTIQARITNNTAAAATYPLTSLELVQLGFFIVRNTTTNGFIAETTISKSTFTSSASGGSVSSHTALSDLNGGANFDGSHTYLTTRNTASAVPGATNDGVGTAGAPSYKTLSLYLDTTNASNPDIYCNIVNTTGAAKWPQILTGLSSDTNSNIQITPTSVTTTFRAAFVGTQNSIVGKGAGSAITSGSGNTMTGYNAGVSITTGSTNIFIGSGSDGSAGVSNQISIGTGTSTSGADGIAIGRGTSAGASGLGIGLNAVTTAGDCQIGSSGSIQFTNAYISRTGGWLVGSDRRLKSNIHPLEDMLEFIFKLEPVVYNTKSDAGITTTSCGFIAQDVEQICIETGFEALNGLITIHPKSGLYNMSYQIFHAITVKALQETNQKIKRLEDENMALKRRLDKILAYLGLEDI
jgi:hypothetical protein